MILVWLQTPLCALIVNIGPFTLWPSPSPYKAYNCIQYVYNSRNTNTSQYTNIEYYDCANICVILHYNFKLMDILIRIYIILVRIGLPRNVRTFISSFCGIQA